MTQNDDLISREALRHDMYEEAFLKDSDMQKWDGGCWIRYKMFERVLERQPAARTIGTWILKKVHDDGFGNSTFNYVCSECGVSAYELSQSYCHRCGADMRGEQDGI